MQMENVFTAYQPFLTTSRILGFNPFNFEGPARRGKFKVKPYNVVATCCVVVVYILNINENVRLQIGLDSTSRILSYGWYLPTVFESVAQLVLFLYQLRKRKSFLQFLKKLHEVDEQV
jgi:7tm Chemosensory receptor